MDPRDPSHKPSALRIALGARPRQDIGAPKEDPPVVARMMVEIRSDGSYTVARGAMEDVQSGQKVAIEAAGTTPMALALSLAKSIATAPWLARTAIRALIRR